jgi:hypothetical protein
MTKLISSKMEILTDTDRTSQHADTVERYRGITSSKVAEDNKGDCCSKTSVTLIIYSWYTYIYMFVFYIKVKNLPSTALKKCGLNYGENSFK